MADRLLEPAMKTPPGVVSQFPTTHSSVQAWFYFTATLSAVIPGILLLLRFYTKWRIVRKLDMVDCIAAIAFLFLIVLIVLARFCVAEGAGVHQWNLPMHSFLASSHWLLVCQMVYGPALFLAKTAILLQYLRLFAPQKVLDPFMWYGARIVIAVAGTFYSITTFIDIFGCLPHKKKSKPFATNFDCVDNEILVLIVCVFNILSDIIILVLPARAVWELRIPIRKKIKIVLLFALGLLACIATIMVMSLVVRAAETNADDSYNYFWSVVWVCAEVSIGVSVTGTFLLPKFIEAEGPKLRGVFSRLTRPFTFGGLFRTFSQCKEDIMVASQNLTPNDKVSATEHSSESDLVASTNHDHSVEQYFSHKGDNNC